MARETGVQSQVKSYQRLKKWYLMPSGLTLSIIRYESKVKWRNPRKGVVPSPTPCVKRCCIVPTIYMRKHSQHNDEQSQFFRKIYLSHFIQNGCERVMYERGVGDWTNCNILTPASSVFSNTSFSFCWAAQSGALRAHRPLLGAGSLYNILYPTIRLQLIELPVAPRYIIVCHPPASCERRICTQFNPSTVKVIPWYLRLDAPVPWSTAGSEVNMLQKEPSGHPRLWLQTLLLFILLNYCQCFFIWNHQKYILYFAYLNTILSVWRNAEKFLTQPRNRMIWCLETYSTGSF